MYKYDVENRLVERRVQTNTTCSSLSYGGAIQAALRYDPLGRLHELGGSGGTVVARFLYDGDALVGEYNVSGTLLRRYVHGSNLDADDPLIWFEGAGTSHTNARHLYADPRGSIVLVGSNSGAALAINTYDEYGIPGSANQGRFQYTGQAWLPELGMYYYKARIYSPTLGRFLQTDPIGYEDQVNLYAYVGNDPINNTDPTGEDACTQDTEGNTICTPSEENVIVVTGDRSAQDRPSMREMAEVTMTLPIDPDGGSGARVAASMIIVTGDTVEARDNGETLFGSLLVALGIKEGAGRNEAHGREPGDAQQRQLAELEERAKTATGRERTQIQNKIKNIRADIAQKRRGENHSQRSKRRR